jgi:hypothetical protein
MNRLRILKLKLIFIDAFNLLLSNLKSNHCEKRLISGIFLFWIFLQPLFSQNYNTRQGYIITNLTDTIYGSFKDRNSFEKGVSFRQKNQNDFKTYSPNDIIGFSLENNLIFRSIEIPLDSTGSIKLFMQILVRGYMSLYYSVDGYFIIEKNSEIFFLKKKEDKIETNSNKSVNDVARVAIEDKRYMGIIKYLVSDCQDINLKFNDLNYSPSDISKIVSCYNNCMQPKTKSQEWEAEKKRTFSFGLKFDYFINDMVSYNKNGRDYDENFTGKQCISGGLIINLKLNRKVSTQVEVLVTQRKANLYKEIPYYSPEVQKWNMVYLEVPIAFYYTFPTHKIQPHIFAGGLLGFKILDNSEFEYTYGDVYTNMSKKTVGYFLGSGLTFNVFSNKKLHLEYYYEMTSLYSQYLNLPNYYHQLSNNISAFLLF